MRLSVPCICGPIGLDIGTYRIGAVQLDGAGRVRAYASFARREPEVELTDEEAARIRTVLDRHGFRGARAVIAATPSMVRSTTLDLPPASSGAPVEQLARLEVARIHRLNPDSFTLGMWELPPATRASGGVQSMVVSCNNAESDALCGRLEAAGIEPVGIDLPATAAARALPIDAESTQAILEFGESRSTLIVLHRGVMIYERPLSEMTLRTLRSQLSKATRTPVAEASRMLHGRGMIAGEESDPLFAAVAGALDPFIEEVAHSAAYASGRYSEAVIKKVYLIGAGASIPGLPAYLGRTLECEFVAPLLADLAASRSAIAGRAVLGEGIVSLGLARWRAEAA